MPLTKYANVTTVAQLIAIIDELPEYIVLFDAEDRIILANKAWRELNRALIDTTEPGTYFEDHLRAALAAGLIPEAKGREQEWLRDRMQRHRNPGEPFEVARPNGRWLRVNEQRLDNGTMIQIVSEITEQKRVADEFRESEERFTAFINHLPAKMHIKDDTGRYIMINPISEQLFGVTNSEVVGKTAGDIFPQHMSEAFGAHDREVLETGKSITSEEAFPTASEVRTFLTVKFPIKDASGRISAVGATGIDITERKEVEQVLRNAHAILEQRVEDRTRQLELEIQHRKQVAENLKISEERFRDIAASSSDWFWEMGPDLRFTYIDESFSQLVGVGLDYFIGKTRAETAHGGVDPQALQRHLDDLNHRRPFRNFQYEFKSPAGTSMHLSLSGTPVFDVYGEFKGYRGAGTNVTAQVESERRARQAQEALLIAKEEAERANQAKTQFLASMSHELRTPLNAILGFAQLLDYDTKAPLTSAQREYVQFILDGGKHLLHLIADVLAFNKIEAGQIHFNFETIPAHKLLVDCLSQIRLKAQENRIEVIDQCSGQTLPAIRSDVVRIKQVLLNVLDNAVKYNRPGGSITLSCEPRDEYLRILISDQGNGIPAGREQELFTPFERLGRESGAIEGTGIGLTIAKRIIELLGGAIGYKPNPPQGSTFWIDIPLSRGEQAEDRPVSPVVETTITETTASPTRTILYVEDSRANMKLMEMVLAKLPHLEMLAAITAEQGLTLARQYHPQLILMDINLPDMSGVDALRQLQAWPDTAEIPVVAVSADAMPRDIQTALDAGFRDYITKPIDVADTQRIITNLLGRQPAAHESPR